MSNSRTIARRPVHNRIPAILSHLPRYAFQGEKRLALDSGVSKSALSRVMTGQSSPSFALVNVITKAIEQSLGKQIDPREIVSLDGNYPTSSVCKLMGCRGCLPDDAYDTEQHLKPEYRQLRPGNWLGNISPRSQSKAKKEVR